MKPMILDDIIDHVFWVSNPRDGIKLNFAGEFECSSVVSLINYIRENYSNSEYEIKMTQYELAKRMFRYDMAKSFK